MRNVDILRALLVLVIFAILFSYSAWKNYITRINDSWPEYRCNPLVMPFAGVLGHDAKKNFGECIQNIQKANMNVFLQPIDYALSLAANLGFDITNSVQRVRQFFNYLRNMVMNTIKTIFSIFLSIIIGFTRMIIKTKDLAMKTLGTMAVTMYMVDGTSKAALSTWKGPVGGILRALCFHPNTMVPMINGIHKRMKDIKINDTLRDGNKVYAILDIRGDKCNPYYKIRSQMTGKDILVSGTHRILDKKTDKFIYVMDYEGAEKTNIYTNKMSCLVTDNHLIPIDEFIFWDWED